MSEVFRIFIGAAKYHTIIRFRSLFFNFATQFSKKRICNIGNHQSDGICFTRAQSFCNLIGYVIHLPGRCDNLFTNLFTNSVFPSFTV